MTPVLVREEALVGSGFFPGGARAGLRGRQCRSRAVPDRDVGSLAGRAAHERDPARGGPPAALLRALVVLPPRGRHCGQGHARHLPHAPVRQGRDVLVLPSRPILDEHEHMLTIEREIADELGLALSRDEHRGRRPRRARCQEVRHRGVAPGQGRSASSRPARTRPTSRPAVSTRATAARRASATCTRSTARHHVVAHADRGPRDAPAQRRERRHSRGPAQLRRIGELTPRPCGNVDAAMSDAGSGPLCCVTRGLSEAGVALVA